MTVEESGRMKGLRNVVRRCARGRLRRSTRFGPTARVARGIYSCRWNKPTSRYAPLANFGPAAPKPLTAGFDGGASLGKGAVGWVGAGRKFEFAPFPERKAQKAPSPETKGGQHASSAYLELPPPAPTRGFLLLPLGSPCNKVVYGCLL